MMPQGQQYTVKDTQTGKTITFRWDEAEPPTDDDMAEVFAAAQSAAPAERERTWGDTARDIGTGLEQTAVGAFVNLGKLVHQVPGVTQAVDALYGTPGLSRQAFSEADRAVTPRNTPQAVGKLAGDIALSVAPSGAITRAGRAAAALLPEAAPAAVRLLPRMAVEAAGSGALAAAQGGDPTTGAVLGAAAPVVGAVASRVAPKLKEAAQGNVMRALGPTRDKMKALGAQLTPEIIRRGLGGSREALQAEAHDAAQIAGQAIDTALKTEHGAKTLGTQPILDALQNARQKYVNVVRAPLQAGEAAAAAPAAAADVVEQTAKTPKFTNREGTAGQLFTEAWKDAQEQGYKGSPTKLRKLFDDAVKDAKELTDEEGPGPKQLLRDIAKLGGLDEKYATGEFQRIKDFRTVVGASGRSNMGRTRGGVIGGVARVIRKGGKSFDGMAEALREHAPYYADILGPNELMDAIEDAHHQIRNFPQEQTLAKALERIGVRPGEKWWEGGDTSFEPAALEAAPAAAAVGEKAPPPWKELVLNTRRVKQIDQLSKLIKDHGDEMTVDQLVGVRRAWDEVVKKSGGFGPGMSLRDSDEAWAKRKGANAIRALLDEQVPDLSKLNKEYHFWAGLDEVLSKTLQRTSSQGPGLRSIAAEGAGRLAGMMTHPAGVTATLGKVWVLGKMLKLAERAFQSPRWQFASARWKDQLADAIMNGRTEQAASVLSRIAATQGAKLGPSVAVGAGP